MINEGPTEKWERGWGLFSSPLFTFPFFFWGGGGIGEHTQVAFTPTKGTYYPCIIFHLFFAVVQLFFFLFVVCTFFPIFPSLFSQETYKGQIFQYFFSSSSASSGDPTPVIGREREKEKNWRCSLLRPLTLLPLVKRERNSTGSTTFFFFLCQYVRGAAFFLSISFLGVRKVLFE